MNFEACDYPAMKTVHESGAHGHPSPGSGICPDNDKFLNGSEKTIMRLLNRLLFFALKTVLLISITPSHA